MKYRWLYSITPIGAKKAFDYNKNIPEKININNFIKVFNKCNEEHQLER